MQPQSCGSIGSVNPSLPRILLSHRYYAPDTSPYGLMLQAIAEGLVSNFDPHVYTLQPTYASDAVDRRVAGRETVAGVTVRRGKALQETTLLRRLVNDLFYCIGLVAHCRRVRPEVIMISTMPPVIGALATWVGAQLVRSKLVYYMLDIYPESIGVSRGKALSAFLRGVRVVDTFICNQCDSIVTLSSDMQRTITNRGIATAIAIINTFELPARRQASGQVVEPLPDRPGLHILFAGNVGKHQNLGTCVRAVHESARRSPVHLTIMGEGSALDSLKEIVNECPDNCVSFLPRQSVEIAKAAMRQADINLVSLAEGMLGVAYPSKVTTILAQGSPILAIVEPESELGQTVASTHLGWTLDNRKSSSELAGDISDLVERTDELLAIRQTCRERAPEWSLANRVETWRQHLLRAL